MIAVLNMKKKVFVSGCYDMLHSGHVAFFEEAAAYGDLYVGLGSDKTVYELKGRRPVNTEQERLYMVRALKYVKEAWVNSGSGLLDFREDLERLMPDILFVNEDGHSPDKARLCEELGIEYVVGRRVPHGSLPARSTTALRQECLIPYRIDLAGGWLDQPYVSEHHPGAVITISIEPDYHFNDRSGMATSTRKKAVELWQHDIPAGDPEQLARILFSYENPPGAGYVSGSQDALGIVLPGLNYLWYDRGAYWPTHIERHLEGATLDWLERHLSLMALSPRATDFHVTRHTDIDRHKAKALAQASDALWEAALQRDAVAFGRAMTASFEAQTAMFPDMVTPAVRQALDGLPAHVLGHKLSGAGGGGYLVLFAEAPVENTLKVRVKRGK